MKFSESELVECAEKLSNEFKLPIVPKNRVIEKINELLIERNNYECVQLGIITKDELALVVLQHFQSLICNHANIEETEFVGSWERVIPEIMNALFKD